MKPRNNRRLIVIPALIRISSHDPTPHARSDLNGLTISRCAAWTSLGKRMVNTPRGRGKEHCQNPAR